MKPLRSERGIAALLVLAVIAVLVLAYFSQVQETMKETAGVAPEIIDQRIQAMINRLRTDKTLCDCNFSAEQNYIFDESDPQRSRSVQLVSGFFEVEPGTCNQTTRFLYNGLMLGSKIMITHFEIQPEGPLRMIAHAPDGRRRDILYTEGANNSLRALVRYGFRYPEGQVVDGHVLPAIQKNWIRTANIALKMEPNGTTHRIVGCDNDNPVHAAWLAQP